jgi:hypothetical protein
MGLPSMQSNNTFVIESELSRHRLFLNGQEIATFTTLDGAEAEANKVANRALPGATLRFELDFKWTLSDLEIRAATMEAESESQGNRSHRSAIKRGSLCG